MNDTIYNPSPHVEACSSRTYTAQEIAQTHKVKNVTVRTRWFKWLEKVAPTALLKTEHGYTELARSLFSEFASVDQRELPAWVADAKRRYSHEWESAGVIDCEVIPENVGGTLALISANNESLQAKIALELSQTNQLIDAMNAADSNLSEAQQQAAIARGTHQAIQAFQLEETVKAKVLNELRQRRLAGGQS
ncbi:MAG: hypothetical protein AAFR18_12990 [Cyanobacteria bacterium J06627_32]